MSWERVQAGGSREGHAREGKGEKEKACKMGPPAKFSGAPWYLCLSCLSFQVGVCPILERDNKAEQFKGAFLTLGMF